MLRESRRERLMAAVQGHETDRVPVSFWYHFRELGLPSGKILADAEIAFAKKYDPDFLKVMHDLPLELPDGMKLIEDPSDWKKIRPLNPRESNFTQQLEALRIMKRELPTDMPIIDTIFNPYAAANKLCGKKIMQHFKANPDAVKQALKAIAVSISDYVSAWIEDGGDGIYYAVDGAMTTTMSEDLYKEVFLPLDRMILETAMEKGAFNMLHIHGTNIMFDLAHDLPSHVLQWSDRTTAPSLLEARQIHQGCISGGVNEVTFGEVGPAEIMDQCRSAVAEAGSTGFILTPGCAIPTDTPEENIFAMRQVVEP